MRNKVLSAIVLIMFFALPMQSQSFVFGPKIGPTIAFQKWNNFDQDALLAYHAALFIESYSEDVENKGTLYAQFGYHTRGSAIRVNDFIQNRNYTSSFKFTNLALTVGARQMVGTSGFKPYYHFGLRLEYTLKTNMDQYETLGSAVFYPNNQFVNKLNYGVSLGGGFQKEFSEFVGGAFELTISPDLSKQYEQPAINNVLVPGSTQPRTISARDIRNLSLEISVVLRLLRKVEYY